MTNSAPVALIPRNILFGNPVKANPQISPDGTMMAYLAPVNDVLNVWVGKIGSEARAAHLRRAVGTTLLSPVMFRM